MKTPERQGLEHPHSGVATHNQTSLHTKQHTQKTVFQDSERLSCLFLLLVTRATLAQSSTPSPPRARFTLLPPSSQDPLDAIQWHIKFIPPHAASQQALDSNWRSPEAKGGVCAKDPPQSGVCLCGVHLNQQGQSPERPLFPFLHHLTTTSHWRGSIHTLPLIGVYEAGSPPFTPEMSFFSCSHCLHVNVMNHTLLSEFLSENEERGDNARLNKHSDNQTEGEEDRRQKEWQGLTGTLMALYNQLEVCSFSQTFLSTSLTLLAASPLLLRTEPEEVAPDVNLSAAQ